MYDECFNVGNLQHTIESVKKNWSGFVQYHGPIRGRNTNLVTITPKEILCSDILVRVFGTLLQRRQVFPMLPMLVPEIISIKLCKYQSRNAKTAIGKSLVLISK